MEKTKLFINLKEYINIIKYLRSKKFDIAIDTQLLLKVLYGLFLWS